MKHYRRNNEHNVDLNRNAILFFDQFLQNRHPNIAGYDTFRDFISPKRAPTTWMLHLGFGVPPFPCSSKRAIQP
jgi:hypothetical protein